MVNAACNHLISSGIKLCIIARVAYLPLSHPPSTEPSQKNISMSGLQTGFCQGLETGRPSLAIVNFVSRKNSGN